MATKTDPVCKMDVDTQNAETKTQHKGQTYYFCSSDCKEKFESSRNAMPEVRRRRTPVLTRCERR